MAREPTGSEAQYGSNSCRLDGGGSPSVTIPRPALNALAHLAAKPPPSIRSLARYSATLGGRLRDVRLPISIRDAERNAAETEQDAPHDREVAGEELSTAYSCWWRSAPHGRGFTSRWT